MRWKAKMKIKELLPLKVYPFIFRLSLKLLWLLCLLQDEKDILRCSHLQKELLCLLQDEKDILRCSHLQKELLCLLQDEKDILRCSHLQKELLCLLQDEKDKLLSLIGFRGCAG